MLRNWMRSGGRYRHLLLLVLAAVVLLTSATQVSAQAWPEVKITSPHTITRGPGFYVSWLKFAAIWMLFLLWAKTTDWVSQDTQAHGFPYAIWNPAAFFPFLVTLFLAALTIPIFAVGYGVSFLAWMVPILVYVIQRNGKLEPHDRVMTPSHIRHLISVGLGKVGVKVSSQSKAAHEKGAPVEFQARAKDPQQAQANLITARQQTGFVASKELFANAVDHHAEKVMMDFAQQGVNSRYQVDGVWHDADDRDRDEGDKILVVLKQLAGLDAEERRKRQEGGFWASYHDRNLSCSLVSQGTKTGERVLLSFAKKGVPFDTLAELGMREKQVEQLKKMMLETKGILLFSSVPQGGLATTLNLSLRSTDRLLRDFVSIEDEANAMPEVENVDVTTYNAAAGESPATVLDKVARKQPDVVVVPELHNAETVLALCSMSKEDHLVFACNRAKEAVEALLRILLLKVPAKKFAPRVIGVVNVRLVRRLCDECKEAYEPPPALLKKLGIPAGRIEQLYKHPENPDEVCPACHGIGYRGRVGVFEVLTVDDTLREALIKQPKLDILRKVARRAGNTTLQEEGIAAVVKGVTSLPELMRVLKQ